MYLGSNCSIIDNSGAKIGRVIYSSRRVKPAPLGSIILVSIIKRDFFRKKIRLGQVFRALVIGRGFPRTRVFGETIRMQNTIILLKRTGAVPISKRIKGPVPLELRQLRLPKLLAMGAYVF
jgi:large subunit ribosomal protein L14